MRSLLNERDVRRAADGRLLTSGIAARFAGVAAKTVCDWIDSGRLKGYRLPGSKDRRVSPVDLLRFLREHGWPVPRRLTALFPELVVCFGLRAGESVPGAVVVPDPFAFGAAVSRE